MNTKLYVLLALLIVAPASAAEWYSDYQRADPAQGYSFAPITLPEEETFTPQFQQEKPRDYLYDYIPDGSIHQDIGVYDPEYVTESWAALPADELSAQDTYTRLRSYEGLANEDTTLVPGFRDETINVELIDTNSNKERFSVRAQEGAQEPITFSDEWTQEADANAYALTETINQILNSEEPLKGYQEAIKNEEIVIKGNGFINSIKYKLIDIISEVTGFVANIFVTTRTTITHTTRYIDGNGNVVGEETEVRVEEETQKITINTTETTRKEVLVEVRDCEDAKKRWEELQATYRKNDCNDKLDALNNAKQAFNDASMNRDQAVLAYQEAYDQLAKHKEAYTGFFTNNLHHQDISYEKQEGWNSVHIWGTDTPIYFKGDGDALLEYINEHEEEFERVQSNYYAARDEAAQANNALEEAKQALQEARRALEAAENAYNDCLEKREEIKNERIAFEKEWKDCVEQLKAQEEIKNELAPETHNDIENAWSAMYNSNHTAQGTGEECPEADEKRREAKTADEEAQKKHEEAKAQYNRANELYKQGELEQAKKKLQEASATAKRAQEIAEMAVERKRAAQRLQDRCNEQAQREREAQQRRQAALEEQMKSDVEKYYNETPMYVEPRQLKLGLHQETDVVARACLDTCEKKLLKLARSAAAQEYTAMTKELGLGVVGSTMKVWTPVSKAGQVTKKAGWYLLRWAGTDSLSEFVMESINAEMLGKLLPQLVQNELLQGQMFGAIMDLDNEAQWKSIQEQTNLAVYQIPYEGKIHSFCVGENVKRWTECNGKVTLMYNPHTRFVVAIVNGDCCEGTLTMSYRVNEYGRALEDPPTKIEYHSPE